jgi:hypothetical protein
MQLSCFLGCSRQATHRLRRLAEGPGRRVNAWAIIVKGD